MKIPRLKITSSPVKKSDETVIKKDSKELSALWDLKRDGVTQSMLATFLTCKEKFRLSYVEGWRTAKVGTAPMEFGSCIHEILDMVYSASKEYDSQEFLEMIDVAISNACKAFEDEKYEKLVEDGNDWDTLAENVSIAEVLLPQYFQYWRSDWFTVEWIALEEVFDIPIEIDGETYRVRGKIDGLQRIKDKLWLFETKTKGRIDEDAIVDKLAIDLQVNLYLWAIWKKYQEFPVGVVYNIIRRPQLRQGKNEKLSEFISRIKADIADRPDFYFMRSHGAIDKSEIKEWEQKELIPILRELIRWNNGEGHFKNVSACTGGFFPCHYLKICGQQETATFKRRTSLFEELNVVPLKKILEKRVDNP